MNQNLCVKKGRGRIRIKELMYFVHRLYNFDTRNGFQVGCLFLIIYLFRLLKSDALRKIRFGYFSSILVCLICMIFLRLYSKSDMSIFSDLLTSMFTLYKYLWLLFALTGCYFLWVGSNYEINYEKKR